MKSLMHICRARTRGRLAAEGSKALGRSEAVQEVVCTRSSQHLVELESALIAFPAGTAGEWLVGPMTVRLREGDVLLSGAHMQSECAREGGRLGVWESGRCSRPEAFRPIRSDDVIDRARDLAAWLPGSPMLSMIDYSN